MTKARRGLAAAIKNLRYAARSGACTVASSQLSMIGRQFMVGNATWRRLIATVNRCRRNPRLDRRTRRRR